MMYTTYDSVDDGSTDNASLIAQLEGLTGNRFVYGYSTPIYYSEIVNTCGPQVAMACLPYAIQDYAGVAQVIGVEMCKTYLYIWQGIFPDDSRPADLLYYLELILGGQNTVFPNRVDYCGNSLGGAELIPPNQLQDILDNLQAKIDALDLTGNFTAYTLYVSSLGPVSPTQLNFWRNIGGTFGSTTSPPFVTVSDDDVNSPIIDLSQGTITSVKFPYTVQPIAAAIQADQYVNDQFNYDASQQVYYYRTTYQQPAVYATQQGIYNYQNTAAKYFIQALTIATQQVMFDLGVNTATVYTNLRNAQSEYNNYQQQLVRPLLTTVNQLSGGQIPVQASGNASVDAAGQQVSDAGLNARAALLRNITYVSTFDTDISGTINGVERVAMEKDVNIQMRTAREAEAQGIIAGYEAAFNAYSTAPDGLAEIIILYTS